MTRRSPGSIDSTVGPLPYKPMAVVMFFYLQLVYPGMQSKFTLGNIHPVLRI